MTWLICALENPKFLLQVTTINMSSMNHGFILLTLNFENLLGIITLEIAFDFTEYADLR